MENGHTCNSGKGKRRLLVVETFSNFGANVRLIDIRTLGQMHNADAIDGDHFRALKCPKKQINETGKF